MRCRSFIFRGEMLYISLIVKVFQPERIPCFIFPVHRLFHLMRAESMPFAGAAAVIIGFLQFFHEQIWNRDTCENIMRFPAFVAVIRLQVQKAVHDVFVEHIQVNRHCPLALAQLVDAHCRVVDETDPRNDAGRIAFEFFYIRPHCPHLAVINADAASVFAEAGDIPVVQVNAIE